MESFDAFKISKQLRYAIDDLGFQEPTPIQSKAFSVISSGKDVVGIAQTGTGKTFAYMLPILQQLPFSKDKHPRVVVIVPTRELVTQAVEEIKKFSAYLSIRVVGVFGGVNMNKQKLVLEEGQDIVVGTPGRLYDLTISRALSLKAVKKVVIDEVDVLLDLGFRFQLTNLFDLLPKKRQNIMFSATMTDEVEELIKDFFFLAEKISVAVSGTPLKNIKQSAIAIPNYNTKLNVLEHLLGQKDIFTKVLVFASNKRKTNQLFEELQERLEEEICVIHSNKTQNYRMRSIAQFNEGTVRVLVTTDIMARGLDIQDISHVINFDTPQFPENYMHRIGRTGRAKKEGNSLLFYTEKEEEYKEAIEYLMGMEIPAVSIPEEVEISEILLPEEQPEMLEHENPIDREAEDLGSGFHEKSEKNKKVNLGGSYRRKIKEKYKKPKTRGDKRRNKK